MYEATLYSRAIGTHYEYFSSLGGIDVFLSDFSLFLNGTVLEFELSEDKDRYVPSGRLWRVKKENDEVSFTLLEDAESDGDMED